ncbi:MAG: hypothetical protein LH477_10625, partial [Nocardioides sp.]|nr:hypothetical protein [Nocardioides sp.]
GAEPDQGPQRPAAGRRAHRAAHRSAAGDAPGESIGAAPGAAEPGDRDPDGPDADDLAQSELLDSDLGASRPVTGPGTPTEG